MLPKGPYGIKKKKKEDKNILKDLQLSKGGGGGGRGSNSAELFGMRCPRPPHLEWRGQMQKEPQKSLFAETMLYKQHRQPPSARYKWCWVVQLMPSSHWNLCPSWAERALCSRQSREAGLCNFLFACRSLFSTPELFLSVSWTSSVGNSYAT